MIVENPDSGAAPGLPTIDDIVSDVAHIAELLDLAVELQLAVPRPAEAAGASTRVDALLWVMRDAAEGLAARAAAIAGEG